MRVEKWALVASRDGELSNNNRFQECWIPRFKSGGYKYEQLLDLETDRAQTRNVADQFPKVLGRMKNKLMEINNSIMADAHDWHLE